MFVATHMAGRVHNSTTHPRNHTMKAHRSVVVRMIGVRATTARPVAVGDMDILDGGRSIPRTLWRRRGIVVDGRRSRWRHIIGVLDGSRFNGGRTMIQALITLPTGAREVPHLGIFPSAGPRRRPLHGGVMMAHSRIGANLHFLVPGRASRSFFWTVFAVGANTFKFGPLGRRVNFKRDRVFPARRARLGAVHGGGCATRVARIACDVN